MYTSLTILSPFRSLSIRKSAYVNACFSVLIIRRIDNQSKFQIFALFFGRHIDIPRRYTQRGVFILSCVNFCEIFRRISQFWGNAQA